MLRILIIDDVETNRFVLRNIIADYINRFVKTRFENGVGSVWIYQVSP